jgi:hypothetical protein
MEELFLHLDTLDIENRKYLLSMVDDIVNISPLLPSEVTQFYQLLKGTKPSTIILTTLKLISLLKTSKLEDGIQEKNYLVNLFVEYLESPYTMKCAYYLSNPTELSLCLTLIDEIIPEYESLATITSSS